jgi:hypothetical protein
MKLTNLFSGSNYRPASLQGEEMAKKGIMLIKIHS